MKRNTDASARVPNADLTRLEQQAGEAGGNAGTGASSCPWFMDCQVIKQDLKVICWDRHPWCCINPDTDERIECGCEWRGLHFAMPTCCFILVVVVIHIFVVSTITLDIQDVALARSEMDPVLIDKTILGPGTFFWGTTPAFPLLVLWPQREQEVVFEVGGLGEIQCNSMDGLQIDIDVSFQYKIEIDQMYELTLRYGDFDTYSKFLESIARANIQHSCGEYSAEDFQKQRNSVAETISVALKADLGSQLGAVVSQTQLRNIQRPTDYDNAVRDKENALNEIALAQAERAQSVTAAETQFEQRVFEGLREVDAAERDSAIEIAQAQADAEAVLDTFSALEVVYSNVQAAHGLNTTGIITYIANEIFSGETLDTKIAVTAPSDLSYQDEI